MISRIALALALALVPSIGMTKTQPPKPKELCASASVFSEILDEEHFVPLMAALDKDHRFIISVFVNYEHGGFVVLHGTDPDKPVCIAESAIGGDFKIDADTVAKIAAKIVGKPA